MLHNEINAELVSLSYQQPLKIYRLDRQYQLISKIFNSRFKSLQGSIKLFEENGKFIGIISERQKKYFENANQMKIEDQGEIKGHSAETTESENSDQPLLTMLTKKDKPHRHKSSIDIIREEINLEEMDTNKAMNDEFQGCSEFGALIENQNKKKNPVRKSSIEMIRDEIEDNEDENQEKEKEKDKEQFSLFGGINMESAIQLQQQQQPQQQQQTDRVSPQLEQQSSLKISPPPGLPLPQKLNLQQQMPLINQDDTNNNNNNNNQFRINDFNWIQSIQQQKQLLQQQQQGMMPIVRSNSEQQGLIRQFSMNKQIANLQQQWQNSNNNSNNTPSSIKKKKLRLESDQFINSPHTPQPFIPPQIQIPQLTPFAFNQQQQQSPLNNNNFISPSNNNNFFSPSNNNNNNNNFISPLLPKNASKFSSNTNLNNSMAGKLEKRKPLILSETNIRYQGTVKFFEESKGYGFIIVDQDSSEVFFHMDDIQQPHVTKEYIMTYKKGNIVRFSFTIMHYIGKYNQSAKATEIQLISSF